MLSLKHVMLFARFNRARLIADVIIGR